MAIMEGDSEFVPNRVLRLLHNSFRFLGGHVFRFPFDNVDELETFNLTSLYGLLATEEGKYYIGVFSSTFVMIALFIIWLILLFDVCLISRGQNIRPWIGTRCIYILLALSFGTSAIGWFYSISAYSNFQGGFDRSRSGLALVEENSLIAFNSLAELMASEDMLKTKYEAIFTQCPENSLIYEAAYTSRAIFIAGGKAIDFVRGLRDMLSGADQGFATVTSILGPVYLLIVILLILFLTCFTALTVFRRRMNIDRSLLKLSSSFISAGTCCLYSAGLVLVIVTWCLAAALSPFGKMGADLCVDDITLNLENALRELEARPINDFCTFDLTTQEEQDSFRYIDIIWPQAAGNLLCYFSECRGFSILFKQLGIDVDVENGTITSVKSVDLLISQIEKINIGDNTNNCSGAKADAVQSVRALILPRFQAIVSALECNVFTSILGVVNDNLCNGILAGIGEIYITWTIGAIGMMVGMYSYLVLYADSSFEDNNSFRIVDGIRKRICGSTKSKRNITIFVPPATNERILIPFISENLLPNEDETASSNLLKSS